MQQVPAQSEQKKGRMSEAERITLKDGSTALVRRLRSTDGPGLTGFYQSLGAKERHYFYPYPISPQHGERIAGMAERPDRITFLALDPHETQVLGYAFVRHSALKEEPLLGICVRPGAQQNGIGKALLSRLVEAARQAGLREVTLGVHKDNIPAIRLYERAGFRICGETRNVVYGVVQWKMRLCLEADAEARGG